MSEEKNLKPEEEMSQYLWDGAAADPEVQRLENLLVTYRHEEHGPTFLNVLPQEIQSPVRDRIGRVWLSGFAFATVVVLIYVASLALKRDVSPLSSRDAGWSVAQIEGTPRIGLEEVTAQQAGAKLGVGQTLETNATSRARISSGDLGEIKVDPDSRVRLVESGNSRKRIQLDVGTIHAMIWAPPGQFVVDTPSATAVDLGCAYSLQVSPDGSGTIRTTLGWVGFHANGRDSFIPAGAMCKTRPQIGPGTPYFEDASQSLQQALLSVDFGVPDADARSAALQVVLWEARPRDALTLWHLFSRTDGRDREAVYERLVVLAPPPAGVTREGVLALQNKMLDAWWDTLGLGDISLWRYWEQSSPPRGGPSGQFSESKQILPKKER